MQIFYYNINFVFLTYKICGKNRHEIIKIAIEINPKKSNEKQNPKKKNIKHIKKVLTESLKDLAEKIQSGQPTANTKIYLAIRTEIQKLQED